jgi:hypothetical protein
VAIQVDAQTRLIVNSVSGLCPRRNGGEGGMKRFAFLDGGILKIQSAGGSITSRYNYQSILPVLF